MPAHQMTPYALILHPLTQRCPTTLRRPVLSTRRTHPLYPTKLRPRRTTRLMQPRQPHTPQTPGTTMLLRPAPVICDPEEPR